MRVTPSPEQAALVRAVLAFANVPRIRSVAQVLAIFRNVPSAAAAFQRVPRASAFTGDQSRVRQWLAALTDGTQAELEAVADEVQQMIDRTVLYRYDVRRGRVVFTFPGVEACFAMGIALMLGPSLRARLRQCRAPLRKGKRICGRYRLDFEGRPRTYCNDEHRLLFDRKDAARRIRERRAAGAAY